MPETDNSVLVPQQELETLAATIRTADHCTTNATISLVWHALTAGDALLAAKEKVPHGGWLKWLKAECNLSEDRAERYMRVARGRGALEANSARVRNLSLAGVLRLIDEQERAANGSPPKTRTSRQKPPPVKRTLDPLAAPSTPEVARDAVLDRAVNSEKFTYAQVKRTIDTAKGRKLKAGDPRIFREMKLGAEIMEKIAGTSLNNARELDALIFLNHGAPQGGHTEIVKLIVAAAAAGEKVSAIAYRKSEAALREWQKGSALRRENISPANSGEDLQRREAAAERIRTLMGGKTGDDTDPTGISESAHQNARGEIEVHVRAENIALRSQVRELTRALEDKLAGLSNEQLLAELERRLSPQFLRTHHAAMKAIRRALDAPGQHAGPVLNLEAMPVTDSEATKH
jgi:hypothetical protein